MRLLNKSQILEEVTLNRKDSIDEGVLVAKKVDVLRETLAKLEAQHSLFAQKSKEELERTLGGLQDGVVALKKQITALEQRREELEKPLDDEWAEVNKIKLENSEINEKLQDKQVDLILWEKEIKKERKKIASEYEKLNTLQIETNDNYDKSVSLKEEAELTSKDMLAKKDEQNAYFETKNLEISKREQENEFNRQANENYKLILDKRAQELDVKERMVNDRYETLLRTEARLNK